VTAGSGAGGPGLRADLARYYDQDAARRVGRDVSAERVRRRTEFVALLAAEGRTRILEVGLGPGRDAVALQAAGLTVAGVDLSGEHVRLAREAGIDARVAPAQELPYGDDSFDAVWCMSVLMHMPDDDLREALAEMSRVLVPGGVAAYGMWGGDDVAGVNPDDTIDPPRYFNRRSERTVRALIEEYAAVEEFDTWTADGDLTYQWCIARF
jgi:SAM-dependent methyltransferase